MPYFREHLYVTKYLVMVFVTSRSLETEKVKSFIYFMQCIFVTFTCGVAIFCFTLKVQKSDAGIFFIVVHVFNH